MADPVPLQRVEALEVEERRQIAVGRGVALQDGDQVGGSRLHDIRIVGQGFMGQPFQTLGRHVPIAQLMREQGRQRAGVIVVEQHRSMDKAAQNFLFRGNLDSIGAQDTPYRIAWPWCDFLIQSGKPDTANCTSLMAPMLLSTATLYCTQPNRSDRQKHGT